MIVLDTGGRRTPQRRCGGERNPDMVTRVLLPAALLVLGAPANGQLSSTTFGGIPFWADSALRQAGLGTSFVLSSTLNPTYAFGDFDRDGLVDVAVEVKDAGGLRCGLAITHAIDRAVRLVGAGTPVGSGANQLTCGRWGVEGEGHRHRGQESRFDLLYATDSAGRTGWLVWDGQSYRWIPVE